jgi:hypothetical protein
MTLATPRQILARAIARAFDDNYSCVPRPGAVPASVSLDIQPDDGVMAVTATTTPSNEDVDACTAYHVLWQLDAFGVGAGAWKPTLHTTHRLGPVVTTAELRAQVDFLARDAAVGCAGAFDTVPNIRMRVTVTATRDADAFVVVANSGDEERDSCTAAELAGTLREYFERRIDEGHAHYFRIDGDARVSLAFRFESSEKHAARADAYYRRRYKYSLGE